MAEIIIDTSTLPKPLLRFFNTETVMVFPENDEVRLVPVTRGQHECPFLGCLEGSGWTLDEFFEEKRRERIQERQLT
jgi:hypothetical protein